MQVTQAETKNARRVGVEEQIIFRPSPNFKNMKKFLKLRSGTGELCPSPAQAAAAPQPAAAAAAPAAAQAVPAPDPAARLKAVEKEEPRDTKPIIVQPPLPPYPPPPDPPTDLIVNIKQEKEDVEPQHTCEEALAQACPQDAVEQNMQYVQKSKKTICKEYIRGNCKRAVCRFAHEVDVSQLPGVYTFCWNYQNAVCSYPNCRFVHATVFEEAEFYRTGVLPDHATRHLKKQTNPTNPPLPPYHEGSEKPPPKAPELRPAEDNFRITLPRAAAAPPAAAAAAAAVAEPRKREWADISGQHFSSPPRDLDTNEHTAKKCKNCEITEHRLQYNKEKVDSIVQSSKERLKSLELLNEKSKKLSNVLLTLVKKHNMLLLDQLHLAGSARLASLISDDNVKGLFPSSSGLASLSSLAKLLCGDQGLPLDSSRDT